MIMILVVSMVTVDDYRVAIADDIKTGKLKLTEKALIMIEEGDGWLKRSGEKTKWGWNAIDNDLYRAFIARVWFERARLEMELESQ